MSAKNFNDLLSDHPFFQGMKDEYLAELAGCASNVHFNKGETIFRLDEEANHFYILREGKVTVELAVAGGKPIIIQTLGEGDVLGWSWLFPPYLWSFDSRASEDTRMVALDARCLRGKCEEKPEMGYELMKRFSAIVIRRLAATRVQLLDMFGN